VERAHETEKLAILRFKQLVREKGLDMSSVLINEYHVRSRYRLQVWHTPQ
jgi:hypothetical protein